MEITYVADTLKNGEDMHIKEDAARDSVQVWMF